jgi:hypothetical protein
MACEQSKDVGSSLTPVPTRSHTNIWLATFQLPVTFSDALENIKKEILQNRKLMWTKKKGDLVKSKIDINNKHERVSQQITI